jgi:hypothetical protein
MIDKLQYIETLIKLIELNNDQTWTPTFRNLWTGGYLPGGGAGSLNDWGPSYTDNFQHIWYSDFYGIMRYLYDDQLRPESIAYYKPIKHNDKFRILRCVDCNGRYQHPSRFESHVAMKFYRENLVNFYNANKLIEILNPLESYECSSIKLFRDWLKSEYDRLGIKIYDFVRAEYICPHCGRQRSDTEHDLYKIEKRLFGKMKLNHIKNNAGWNDFE